MHFINPFKGLRPIEDKASSVSIPSTDQISQEEIVNHKKNNPWTYLTNINTDSEKYPYSESWEDIGNGKYDEGYIFVKKNN